MKTKKKSRKNQGILRDKSGNPDFHVRGTQTIFQNLHINGISHWWLNWMFLLSNIDKTESLYTFSWCVYTDSYTDTDTDSCNMQKSYTGTDTNTDTDAR